MRENKDDIVLEVADKKTPNKETLEAIAAVEEGEGLVESKDAQELFDMLDIFMEKDVQIRSTLRNHYLAQWLDYEPIDRLNEAWKTASILAAVHHAVSYQTIVANIEPAARHELEWGVAYWMRRILELFDKQSESDD